MRYEYAARSGGLQLKHHAFDTGESLEVDRTGTKKNLPAHCLKASPADECASEGEECFVDAVAYLPANARAAKQRRWANARSTTSVGCQAGAVLGAAAGDHRLHAETPHQAAVPVVIVATVTQHHIRAAPEPAALARTGGTAWRSGISWVTPLRKSRRNDAGALAAITPAVVKTTVGQPSPRALRTALYGWAYNKRRWTQEHPSDVTKALRWPSPGLA
ncbi:hypothetical protein ACFYO2_30550 [Streptomyces sp. NPDC006602]|uniref:hypothetical protein n=1 Tax=Streptomyces sp. NPDC006602 TaxID=3364751 RepID=UPI0036850E99